VRRVIPICYDLGDVLSSANDLLAREEDLSADQAPLRGSSIPSATLWASEDETQLTYSAQPKSAGRPDPLAAGAFNQLSPYANSLGDSTYYYAEFVVSSEMVAATIANPLRDGQAELYYGLA